MNSIRFKFQEILIEIKKVLWNENRLLGGCNVCGQPKDDHLFNIDEQINIEKVGDIEIIDDYTKNGDAYLDNLEELEKFYLEELPIRIQKTIVAIFHRCIFTYIKISINTHQL